ncbi:zf-HC2 domain-containing protein [Bacillus sp. SD088]|uniref:zf-HC2 domain-containing protein n=1 Tax=Bacillus sp. SD088 TaxID=2782012 RepID=UPI001A96AADA|nr:zf-HC2 domain-containing protein [Bacillus sp. SD088]MBO0991967.1 zf-HC2 domain-containing protein [Bacillus sp. SD088]
MVCKHSISEQKIIDYVLGDLPSNEELEVSAHLEECKNCQQAFNHWQNLLLTEKEQPYFPSPKLKEQIWESFEAKQKRKEKSISGKRVFSIASLAVMVCLFVGLIYYNQDNTEQNSFQIARYHEGNIQDFREKPDTQQLSIIPVSNEEEVMGNVWINQMTDQMFLEVHGLQSLNNYDYQLWVLYNNDDIQHEIIPIEEGSTRVLIQGKDFSHLKRIKASIEPKGGSHVQTGPDTFIVEVKY